MCPWSNYAFRSDFWLKLFSLSNFMTQVFSLIVGLTKDGKHWTSKINEDLLKPVSFPCWEEWMWFVFSRVRHCRWKPAKFGESSSRWGFSTLQFVFIYHSTWTEIMMCGTRRAYSWQLNILNTNTNAFYLRPVLKQQATEINCYQGERFVHCDQLQCHRVCC
jgi:hypothetical protein